MKDNEQDKFKITNSLKDIFGYFNTAHPVDRHIDWEDIVNATHEIVNQETANLKSIIAERDKEIEELKAAVNVCLNELMYESMTGHYWMWARENTRVPERIMKIKALIQPLVPQPQEQPPQPSTP